MKHSRAVVFYRTRVAAESLAEPISYLGLETFVVPCVLSRSNKVFYPETNPEGEYIPSEVMIYIASNFNGRPVVLDHPLVTESNPRGSANAVEVYARHFGVIMNCSFYPPTSSDGDEGRMRADLYLWPSRARGKSLELVQKAIQGQAVEVSIGAYVLYDETPGELNGLSYSKIWITGDGDHLAFIDDGEGACNNDAGCGTNMKGTKQTNQESSKRRSNGYETLPVVSSRRVLIA